MNKSLTILAIAALASTACARTAEVESAGAIDPQVTAVSSTVLPAGSTLQVRLNESLGTESNEVGDDFSATVTTAVTAEDGAVVVPAGAMVHGKVTGLDDSDHVGDAAAIRLDFERLMIDGESYPFEAQVTTTQLETQGADTREETIKKAGVGAAAGAVLGAIIGEGDISKILVGGAIGAAAGTVISLGTGDVEAALPAGTEMTLRATEMVSLR